MLMLIATVSACTSSKRKEEEVAALRNSYAPVQDMEIVVSGGVNLYQYSERLTDALLKFKNSEDGCKQAAAKFEDQNQKALAAGVCQHLGTAMDAYISAKEFFGDTHKTDLDPFTDENMFGEKTYEDLRNRFPGLEEIQVGIDYSSTPSLQLGKFYWRGDMLQALWRLANRERQTAKSQMDQLSQM